MDEHTLRVLEFYKVRELIKGLAASEPGRAEVDTILPSADAVGVERSLKETSELTKYLASRREFPIHGLKEIGVFLKKAAVEGAILRPDEFLDVLSVARTSRLVKSAIDKAKSECPTLYSRTGSLSVFDTLEREISRAISDEGEVQDGASFELKGIRRSLTQTRARINRELEGIIQDPAYAKVIQEPVITMRGERYVLPLKPNFKMSIHGIVHDHSASGSTVFVEPEKTVELNNRLVRLKSDERAEVEKVLWGLTNLVRGDVAALSASFSALAGLDTIYAKASYAASIDARMPLLLPGDVVELKAARHPLLVKAKGESAVPIDVELGRDYSSLVITGPNTGGKTVVLKTVGLLVLMSQAGMLIPCAEDSAISVFDNVFSDIGDEQSLEQSLSTFSAHITQIAGIIAGAGRGSLVLLDELGAGTDPAEGSALGVAILDELHGRGCRTVVTTHHGALKLYAANTKGAMNASVEFDPDTLLPTYRLLIGRPGRSNALLVADRLGIPKHVTEAASKTKGAHDAEMDALIERLEKETATAREERAKAASEVASAREERARLKELLRRAEEERRESVRKAKEKAASVVTALRIKLRELEALTKASTVPDKTALRKKAYEIQALESELKLAEVGAVPSATADINKLKPGDTVRVYRHGKTGQVVAVNKGRGQVVVQMGALKVKLTPAELEPVEQVSGTSGVVLLPRKAAPVTMSREEESPAPDIEINVIGLRAEEAVSRVEKYLDECLLAGLNEVRIIHGRGTGALRKAIAGLLKGHRAVKAFHAAPFDEGGDAVTLVEL